MSPGLPRGQRLGAKLEKVRGLSSSDWLLLLQAAGWFVLVELGLRLFAVKRLLAFLGGKDGTRKAQRGGAPPSPDRLAYLAELASRAYPLRANCLKKALVLYALLQRRGVEVKLIIGAAKTGKELDAHAWLEYQGRVLIGEPSGRYEPLCTLAGG